MKTWFLKHMPTLVGVMFLWAGLYKLAGVRTFL